MTTGEASVVSIAEAFSRARDIRSIEADNPFQTAAISRLLLAIMYRAITPLYVAQKDGRDEAAVEFWKLLWEDEDNDVPGIIAGYLDEYVQRFDLFDKVRPFFQIPGLEYANEEAVGTSKFSIGRIMPEQDKISVFRKSDFEGAVTYAEAARILVTYQSWSTTTILSPVNGMYSDMTAVPRVYQGGRKGWCGSIGLTMMNGRNLYETLVLNTLPQQLNESDIPFWEERTARKVPVMFEPDESGRVVRRDEKWEVRGQVQLFVWFAKSVRLVEKDGMVVGAVASEYNSLPKAHLLPAARLKETQTGWRETANGEGASWHFFDDAAWSNFPILMPVTREGFVPPKNVVWAAKVTNLLGITVPAGVRIIGAQADDKWQTFRGAIDRTVDSRSFALLGNPSRLALLNDTAEAMIGLVQKAYFGFARDCSFARLGIVDDEYARAMMVDAYAALDSRLVDLYADMTTSGNDAQQVASQSLERCARDLLDISRTYSERVPVSELIGRWITDGGARRLASVAAGRAKLVRRLRKYATEPELDIEDAADYVAWSIKKGISPQANGTVLDSAVKIWSVNKRLRSGEPTHKQFGSFSFLSPLDTEGGKVFGGITEQLISVRTEADLVSAIRSVAGIINSRNLPADFGLIAAVGSEVLEDDKKRVDVAQKLVAHLSH